MHHLERFPQRSAVLASRPSLDSERPSMREHLTDVVHSEDALQYLGGKRRAALRKVGSSI